MGTALFFRKLAVPGVPPTSPELTGTAWEYNQISLDWGGPLVDQAVGDIIEIQISIDGGITWEENFRIIPYESYDRADASGTRPSWLDNWGPSGGPAAGSFVYQDHADMAGFDADTTYHFRIRPFTWNFPDHIYGSFTNVVAVTTPAYVTSGVTNGGGEVLVVPNRAAWFALESGGSPWGRRVRYGDILELPPTATDLFTLPLWVPDAAAPGTTGKWVTVRSQNYDTSGLTFDKRATQADKPNMTTVYTDTQPNDCFGTYSPVTGTASDFYTIEGVHMEVRPDTPPLLTNAGFWGGGLGPGGSITPDIDRTATHIEIHRCVIDKVSIFDRSNEGALFANFFAVLKDCTVIGGSKDGAETHGVGMIGHSTMIDNCYVSAGSISAFSGFSDSGIRPLNNENAHWKRCYITAEQEVKDDPFFFGRKNLWETKSTKYCTLERCILEWDRYGGDQTNSIGVYVRQSFTEGREWRGFRMRWNKILDIKRGMNTGHDTSTSGLPQLITNDIVVEHNLWDGMTPPTIPVDTFTTVDGGNIQVGGSYPDPIPYHGWEIHVIEVPGQGATTPSVTENTTDQRIEIRVDDTANTALADIEVAIDAHPNFFASLTHSGGSPGNWNPGTDTPGLVGTLSSGPGVWQVEIGGESESDATGLYVTDVAIRHNTFINKIGYGSLDGIVRFEANSNPRLMVKGQFIFNDNIGHHHNRGITAQAISNVGTDALESATELYDCRNNVLIGSSANNSPTFYHDSGPNGTVTGNAHDADEITADFEDYTNQDYRLKSTSPYKAGGAQPATDGTDRGCDIATLDVKTMHCIDGNWVSVGPLSIADISDLEEWADNSYELYSDAGITLAVDGDNIQQGTGRSSLALVRSNATASQRPVLRAATLAVPSLEYDETVDTALLYPSGQLELGTDDATWFHVFQFPLAVIANAKRMLGNWAPPSNPGYMLGSRLGKFGEVFIRDGAGNTIYIDTNAVIEVTWGDMVIVCVRWKNSEGKLRLDIQRSDKTALQFDCEVTNAAMIGANVDSPSQFTIGRCNGQTTLDWSGRDSHFAMFRRYLPDNECQLAANEFRRLTDLVPQYWMVSREPTNPINSRPAGVAREQYVPGPFMLASATDRYFYAKGSNNIYLWKSNSFSTPQFSLENGGSAVLLPGAAGQDDENAVSDPFPQYDPSSNTVYLYHKGFKDTFTTFTIRYATAPDTNPSNLTKQSTLLTEADFNTAFGDTDIRDISISSRIKIGSTWHVFGTRSNLGNLRIWRGTDTGFGTAITLQTLLPYPSGDGNYIVQEPSICKNPSGPGYFMFYTRGISLSGDGERHLYVCYSESADNDDWQHVGTALIHQASGWEKSRVYAARLLIQQSGNYDTPVVDPDGNWQLFYSGSNLVDAPTVSGAEDLVGLAYLKPLNLNP